MPVLTQRAAIPAIVAPHAADSGGSTRNAAGGATVRPAAPRRRGRPPLLAPEQVLQQIRREFGEARLFRVHVENPALYARARRVWGSWAKALRAAGLDPRAVLDEARQRARETRRRKHRHALS